MIVARELSKVSILGLDSYAGYFTVNPKYDGNMYFWFFKAKVTYDIIMPVRITACRYCRY